jgi:threonine/homoserine/homoserine lactone efflux protein
MAINWPAFLAVVFLAYVIPGPDFLVVVRAGTTGLRRGLTAGAGAQTGLVVHMLAAACGVSLLLARSPSALRVIQLAGAAYLTHLGVRALLSTRRATRTDDQDDQDDQDDGDPSALPRPGRPGHWYRQGLTTNLLNPKAVLFFVSVLPQFLDSNTSTAVQVLVLGVLDIAIGLAIWAVLAAVASHLAGVLARPRARRAWDRATGATFVGLGAILAGTRL